MRLPSLSAVLFFAAAFPLGAESTPTSLNDDFNGRKSDWVWLGTKDTTVSKLDRGILRWHNTSTNPDSVQTTSTDIRLGLRNDYELSVRMRMVTSAFDDGLIGFRWALDSDAKTYYQFELVPNQTVRLDVIRDNELTRLIDWRTSPAIKAGEFNTFTIRQVGRSFYAFANDQLFAVGPSRDLSGGKFALRIGGGVEAEFDFVHTRALPAVEATATVAAFDALLRARPDEIHPLLENFDDNQRNWLGVGDQDESFGEIADGIFHYENLQLDADSARYSGLLQSIDDQRNFAVETRLRFVGGIDERTFGLALGRDGKTGARRYLTIANNQTFRAGYNYGKQWHTDVPTTEAQDLIKANDYNTLGIQNIGNTVYYLINDTVVGRAQRTPYLGRGYGFTTSSGVSIDVDHYHLTYLPQSPDQTATLIAHLDDGYRDFRIAHGPTIEPWVDPFDDNTSGWIWTGVTPERAYTFAGGVFKAENKTKGSRAQLLVKSINEEVDYDLRLILTHLDGPTNTGTGLVWGRSADGDDGIKFLIAPDGHYLFKNVKAKISRFPIEWTKIENYRAKAPNELLVRKIGERYFMYLNEQLLADAPVYELEGTRLGMEIGGDQTIAFDEISLTYQPRSGAESQAEFARLDAELAAAYRAKQIVGVVHQPTFRAEQNAKISALREAQRLDDKDDKERTKARKKYDQQPILSVYADWGKPFKVVEVNSRAMRVYYKYRDKAGLQYYYQFTTMVPPGRSDELTNHVISGITLTDNPY